MKVRRHHIRTVVKDLISEHNVNAAPPVDVYRIAREKNIKIVEEPASDDLSGFLLRDTENNKAVIGVNKLHPFTRRRFTVAHEIGHYLLHDYEGFHFDGPGSGLHVRFRDQKAHEGTDIDEREANLFAAELLMPEDFILNAVNQIGTVDLLDTKKLEEMAKMFKVSTQALMYRLTSLGHIA